MARKKATDNNAGGIGDFGSAISQICEEKGISKDKVIETIEAALEHRSGRVAAALSRCGWGALRLECRLNLEGPCGEWRVEKAGRAGRVGGELRVESGELKVES